MKGYFWLASIHGFLHSDIHKIPPQAVPITEEEWRYLIDNQGGERQITTGEDGKPYLRDVAPKLEVIEDVIEAEVIAKPTKKKGKA